jgi:hypothetical protein
MMVAPVANAFEKFEADLKQAVGFMERDSRMAAGLAVKAALEFVYAHQHFTEQGLNRPLYALLAALDDLNKGRVAPMLKPRRVDNRRPDSAVRKEAMAHACFCIDQLMELGESVESASKAVADVWAKHKISFGSKYDTPDWKTIRDWRYKVSKLCAGDPQRIVITTMREHAAGDDRKYMGMGKKEFIAMLDRTLSVMGSKAALE